MKKNPSYSRGPYKKRQREKIDEEVVEEMITELREFSYRIQRLFDISHYRSRIVESLQREIDCLEKIRKRQKERDDEIQELKNRISRLEEESLFNIQIDKLLDETTSLASKSNQQTGADGFEEENSYEKNPPARMVSEKGNQSR